MNKQNARKLSGIFLLVTILLSTYSVSSQKPILWGDLSPGSYEVGFRTKTFFDKSRKDAKKSGRLIEVMIWYPATTKPNAPKLTLDIIGNNKMLNFTVSKEFFFWFKFQSSESFRTLSRNKSRR